MVLEGTSWVSTESNGQCSRVGLRVRDRERATRPGPAGVVDPTLLFAIIANAR